MSSQGAKAPPETNGINDETLNSTSWTDENKWNDQSARYDCDQCCQRRIIIRRDAVSAEAEIKYRKIIGGEMKRGANARRGRLTMSEDKVVGLKSMSIEG